MVIRLLGEILVDSSTEPLRIVRLQLGILSSVGYEASKQLKTTIGRSCVFVERKWLVQSMEIALAHPCAIQMRRGTRLEARAACVRRGVSP